MALAAESPASGMSPLTTHLRRPLCSRIWGTSSLYLGGASEVHRSWGSLQCVSVSMMLMPGKIGLTVGMGYSPCWSGPRRHRHLGARYVGGQQPINGRPGAADPAGPA